MLTGVCVSSLFAVGAAAIALVLAPFLGYGGSFRSLLLFASIDILLLSPLRLPGIIFQVDLRQWYGVGIGLIRQFVWLIVLVAMAIARASLLWIILGRTGCALFEVALIAMAVHHKGLLARPWRLVPTEAKKYLKYGFPIAVSTLAVGIYHRIDQVMLHKMVNDQVLGNYVAAVRLTEFINLLPIAVMTTLFPILSQTAKDAPRFRHYLQLSFRALMAIAFGVCIVMSLFSGPIVKLLYGAKFAAAGPILAVLIWSEVPVFFGVVIANGLIAKNLQIYLPLSTGIGAAGERGAEFVPDPAVGSHGVGLGDKYQLYTRWHSALPCIPAARPITWLGFRILAPPGFLALIHHSAVKNHPRTWTTQFLCRANLVRAGSLAAGSNKKERPGSTLAIDWPLSIFQDPCVLKTSSEKSIESTTRLEATTRAVSVGPSTPFCLTAMESAFSKSDAAMANYSPCSRTPMKFTASTPLGPA